MRQLTVYRFDELSEDVQQKLINTYDLGNHIRLDELKYKEMLFSGIINKYSGLSEVLSLYKMGITKEGVFLVNVEEIMCEIVCQIIEYWKKRWGERGDQVVVEWEIFHTTPLLGAFTNDCRTDEKQFPVVGMFVKVEKYMVSGPCTYNAKMTIELYENCVEITQKIIEDICDVCGNVLESIQQDLEDQISIDDLIEYYRGKGEVFTSGGIQVDV
jgi:hypothetical protein